MIDLRSRLCSLLLLSLSISMLPIFALPVIASTPRAVTLSDCSQVMTGTLTQSTTVNGSRCITTFLSGSGTWTPNAGVDTAAVLVVGGGGGGGSRHGGGGGAGGVVYAVGFRISGSAINVVVGNGGNGTPAGAGGTGTSGSNSTFLRSGNGLTASGGGGGGGVGLAGGSGGGSNYEWSAVGTTNQSSQTQRSLSGTTLNAGSNADGTLITNYGNDGGLGIAEIDPNYCQRDWCGGGGGGAGAVGGNATRSGFGTSSSNGLPGNGGIGIVNPISGSTIGQLVSSSYYLAGGGGGASSDNGLRGSGGSGGGGAGGNNMIAATAGTANTGGGGGGGGFANGSSTNPNGFSNQAGGTGGSGVVIVSYTPDTTAPTSPPTAAITETGTALRLTYNEALSSTTAAASRFTVTRVPSETITVSSVSASGSVVTLNLASTIFAGETITVSYSDPSGSDDANAIQDLAGNDAASFTNIAVTNSSTQKRSQSITFGALSNRIFGSGSFSFPSTDTATSGLAVTFTSTTAATCSVSDRTVTLLAAGSCSITASQSGNISWSAATSVTQSFTITTRPLTIKAADRSATYTGSAVSVSNTYSITSGTLAGSDSVTSLTYTYTSTGGYNSQTAPTAAGTYTITPSAASFSPGSASNYALTYETATLTIGRASQTISFTAPTTKVFGSGSFTLPLTDTTTSGLAIAFASTTPSICTLSGADSRTVTLIAAGTCTLTADQAGDSNYTAASQVTRSFIISKATTSLSSFSIATKTFGNAPFTLTAPTVTGSLAGTFSYSSSNTLIATISDSAVTIVKAGSVTITALFTPTDSANYETSTITATLTIDKANQASLLISSDTTVAFGSTLTLTTSGGSGVGSLSFTPSGDCSISGSTLTPTQVGSCTVTATKASDDNYLAETSSVTTITITTGSATATISFTSTSFTFGITNPITVTTSVAGSVRFSANGKLIKNCKARSTTLTGPFTATCSYRPDTRRPLTITAILTPTDTRFATRTSTSGTFLVGRRTGTRG